VIETGRRIGCRVDAAGDGRAPGAVAFSNALEERGDLILAHAHFVRVWEG